MKRYRMWHATFLGVALVACGGGNPLDPTANQLQVTNAADNFQWQASNLDNVSQTLTYSWSNTGAVAKVDDSSTLTGGSATLSIKDPSGAQVYSQGLGTPAADVSSIPGSGAGTWTLVVKLSGVTSSALNFRVQKTP